jgi:hypothetical protein
VTTAGSGSDPAGAAERSRIGALRRVLGRRVGTLAWVGRASAVGLCLSSIAFVAGFVFVLSSGGNPALATVPPLLRVVFALPYLVALFAFGTVAGAVSGWRQGYWSLAGRVHQTILAVIAVVFAWQLLVLGFLP